MLRSLSVLLILISISGCTTFDEKIVIQKEHVYLKIVCQTVAEVSPIVTNRIKPRAIEDKAGIYWVGLSPEDYANLAINTQETIRYIKSQRENTRYYQSCVSDFNLSIERLENDSVPKED